MSTDQTNTGVTNELLKNLGIEDIECLRDEILIIGLKQSFSNLATPVNDQGPMDHPTKGLVLACGPDCAGEKIGIAPGMVVFFAKFSATEIQVGTRRFFILKGGTDAKARQRVTTEQANELAKNTY